MTNGVFVTDDSNLRGGKLDEADLEILRSVQTGAGIPITSAGQLHELALAADRKMRCLQDLCRSMTRAQADFIYKLRVTEGYSWRAVARNCYENKLFTRWPKSDWWPPSNQIMGIALCQAAAGVYNKEPGDRPRHWYLVDM